MHTRAVRHARSQLMMARKRRSRCRRLGRGSRCVAFVAFATAREFLQQCPSLPALIPPAKLSLIACYKQLRVSTRLLRLVVTT